MRIGIYADDPGLVERLSIELPGQIIWATGRGLENKYPFPVFESIDEAMAYQKANFVIDCTGGLQIPGVPVVPVEGALYLLSLERTHSEAASHPGYVGAASQLSASIDKMTAQLNLLTSYGAKLAQVGDQLEETSTGIADDLDRTGRILDSISRIAKRSKIIGLNSAIEAARVGEQGRGFAVVAEEIKSLADDSSQSILGIERILEGIQRRSKEFLAGTSAVADLSNLVHQATADISALLESVKELGQHLKQLAKDQPALYSLTD